jgi:hypothetical protein
LLLEALGPLVAGHVDDVDGQDETPVEGFHLKVALLAAVHPVVLILDLKTLDHESAVCLLFNYSCFQNVKR